MQAFGELRALRDVPDQPGPELVCRIRVTEPFDSSQEPKSMDSRPLSTFLKLTAF